jgi:hypothetical protein
LFSCAGRLFSVLFRFNLSSRQQRHQIFLLHFRKFLKTHGKADFIDVTGDFSGKLNFIFAACREKDSDIFAVALKRSVARRARP